MISFTVEILLLSWYKFYNHR